MLCCRLRSTALDLRTVAQIKFSSRLALRAERRETGSQGVYGSTWIYVAKEGLRCNKYGMIDHQRLDKGRNANRESFAEPATERRSLSLDLTTKTRWLYLV